MDFPETLVEKVAGHFKPGGMVALQLKPGVSVHVDGRPVPADKGLAVFGYGRDAGTETTLKFSIDGQDYAIIRPLEKRDFNIQYVEGMAQKYVSPPETVLKRIRLEGQQKKQARRDSAPTALFGRKFYWPLKGRITGVYGSQRYFNGEPRRPHYGIDIAAPAGSPVMAMTSGTVTLAEPDMYYEGGLVFIDHGMGLLSAYLHLSQINVKSGDKVDAQQIIGRVGSAGRSTGPHLDWRVYWRDKRLDPALLVSKED
ncbi:MAG: M23 family metallopeptidase [Pseudomonadota bacterium]|nr:M23 family metallopeptidase [Pseudomonadota bacterium]